MLIIIDAIKYIADKYINVINWSNKRLEPTTNFMSLLSGEFFNYFNLAFDGINQLGTRFYIAILSIFLIMSLFYKMYQCVNILKLRNEELVNSLRDKVCCICKAQNSTVALMPCAHLCLCLDCFHLLKENAARGNRDKLCPLCRKLIQSDLRIY